MAVPIASEVAGGAGAPSSTQSAAPSSANAGTTTSAARPATAHRNLPATECSQRPGTPKHTRCTRKTNGSTAAIVRNESGSRASGKPAATIAGTTQPPIAAARPK